MKDLFGSILGGAGNSKPGKAEGGLGSLLGGMLGSGGSAMLLPSLLGVLGGQGGLAGLLQRFQAGGLGDIVGSWTGSGPKQPITPDQVQQGMGQESMNQLSNQSGLPVQAVAEHLTSLLPAVVSHVSSTGQGLDLGALEGILGKLQGR